MKKQKTKQIYVTLSTQCFYNSEVLQLTHQPQTHISVFFDSIKVHNSKNLPDTLRHGKQLDLAGFLQKFMKYVRQILKGDINLKASCCTERWFVKLEGQMSNKESNHCTDSQAN